ncbi:MAG: hypothetical protein JXA30_15570 [Deltaproteobacteria bacterium]|nr:hypothetical protein [Deltaproteobacteria bacterium]
MGKLKMTVVAQEAMDIGDHLMMLFSNRTFGDDPTMRLEVAKPDGPSTDGGKKARQTIALVPVADVGGKVMLGWLDVALKRVELRSFRVVRRQYHDRYGTTLVLPQQQYDKLVEVVSDLLRHRGFNVLVKDDMPARLKAAPEESRAVPWIWVAAALAVGAGGIALGALLF